MNSFVVPNRVKAITPGHVPMSFHPLATSLPPESAARFERLRQSIYDRYRPASTLQRSIADLGADSIWSAIHKHWYRVVIPGDYDTLALGVDRTLDSILAAFDPAFCISTRRLAGLDRGVAAEIRSLDRMFSFA